jgi:hypothetical protein
MSSDLLIREEGHFAYIQIAAKINDKVLKNGGHDEGAGGQLTQGSNMSIEHNFLSTLNKGEPEILFNG